MPKQWRTTSGKPQHKLFLSDFVKIDCMTTSIRPNHYKNSDKTVELIELIRPMPFGLGNAIKYIFRCRKKNNKIEDLTKAIWYTEDALKNGVYWASEISNLDLLTLPEIKHVLSACDDFEHTAIMKIYDGWREKEDFKSVIQDIQQEVEDYSA